jgi:hypothetical protein
MITSVKKINKCSPSLQTPSTKKFGQGFPLWCKLSKLLLKKHICQWFSKFRFATSHFVIELLPFDYLSNQKQRVNKKCISRGITLHTVVAHFQLWEMFSRSWHAEHFYSLNFTSISNSVWDIRWKYWNLEHFDEKRAKTPK